MKRFIFILIVLLVGFSVYWFFFKPKRSVDGGSKMTPIALKKHSENFNASIDKAVSAYYAMKDAFVEDDTLKVKQNAAVFISLLDSIPLDELKKDTAGIFETAQSNVNDIKSNTKSLIVQTSITEMRRDFSTITEMMYPSFFKVINYEGPVVYLQNCPMAFRDEQAANWLSNSSQIMNPYLGKHHPEYKAGMLHCGSVKDSIKSK